MADVEAEGFTDALEAASEDLAMEAARRWHSAASERLQRVGDELEYEVFPVLQGLLPPEWDAREQAAVFQATHPASKFFEHGTTHDEAITGNPVLVFEWEEMRGEEFGDTGKNFEEVFDEFPTVFLPEVQPEGIDRIGYMAHGRGVAQRWLQSQGE